MTEKNSDGLSVSTLLALAAVAVVPLAVATGFSNFERARQVVLAGFASLSLLLWAVDVVRHREIKVASPGTLAMGAAFAAAVMASVAWSGVWQFGALSAVMWVSLGALFMVLVAPASGRFPRFLEWVTAVGAGVIGAAGMGIYEAVGGSALVPVWDPTGIAGGFDSIIFAALFYALALPLLIAGVALANGARRIFLGVATAGAALHLAMVVPGLILGLTAGAMVVLAVVVKAVGGSFEGERLKVGMGAGVLALLIAGGGLMGLDRPDRENVAVDLPRVAHSTDDLEEMAQFSDRSFWYFDADRMESPLDQRYRPYLQSVTRGLWSQEPLIGHGAGGWWLKQTDVIDDSDPVVGSMFDRYPAFRSPHSDPARIVVEQGVVGMSLWALFLLSLLTVMGIGMKSLKRGETRPDKERGGEWEVWALSTTVVLGMVLSFLYPLMELGSSALLWVGTAAVLVGFVGQYGRGKWSTIVEIKPRLVVAIALALVAVVVGAALAVPSALNAKAGLERGHGDHLMLKGYFTEAAEAYEAAHAAYPAHADVLYNTSLAYGQMGQSMRGVDALDEALLMRPYDARYKTDYTAVMLMDQHVDTALVAGEEAVRLGPNYLRAYEVYGATLLRRVRYEEVATLLNEIMDRNPPGEPYNRAKRRYAELLADHLGEPERARKLLMEVVEEMPFDEERELLQNRISEIERRVERERFEAAGLAVPPQLEDQYHDHDHGHDHGPHHGPHDHGGEEGDSDHPAVDGPPDPLDLLHNH